MIKIYSIACLFMALLLCTSSCKKQDSWLDAKSNNHDVTPQTLQDFQAVLDNNQVMNGYSSVMGLVGTDNLYTPDANLDAADVALRNAYLWSKDIFQGAKSMDWSNDYQVVEYANVVLDGLKSVDTSPVSQYNNIEGSALFYRAFAFYELAQLFCKPYIAATASSDLGVPLRLSSDVNVKYDRGTVQKTYDQIVADLKIAVNLLPQTPLYKTRPSSVAANALLSKVYLCMGDYKNALTYANFVLNANSALIDYNTLTIGTSNPFPSLAKGNSEVLFHAWAYGNNMVYATSIVKGRIDPLLYASYEAGDLRKTAFFTADGTTGFYKFRGPYSANPYNFCGIASDEIYLIRAECNARSGNIDAALSDLNLLLKNRYTASSYKAIPATDAQNLINRIILERRKEMPLTGNIRWEDLRRLNLVSTTAVSLSRNYHGTVYNLAPNDARYVMPLPDEEIQLDHLPQNIR